MEMGQHDCLHWTIPSILAKAQRPSGGCDRKDKRDRDKVDRTYMR